MVKIKRKGLQTILLKDAKNLVKHHIARYLYFESYNENLLIYRGALYILEGEKENQVYFRVGAYPPKLKIPESTQIKHFDNQIL